MPFYARLPLKFFSFFLASSPSNCGQVMLYILTCASYRVGGFWVDGKAEDLKAKGGKGIFVGDGERKVLVEHFKKEVGGGAKEGDQDREVAAVD